MHKEKDVVERTEQNKGARQMAYCESRKDKRKINRLPTTPSGTSFILLPRASKFLDSWDYDLKMCLILYSSNTAQNYLYFKNLQEQLLQ